MSHLLNKLTGKSSSDHNSGDDDIVNKAADKIAAVVGQDADRTHGKQYNIADSDRIAVAPSRHEDHALENNEDLTFRWPRLGHMGYEQGANAEDINHPSGLAEEHSTDADSDKHGERIRQDYSGGKTSRERPRNEVRTAYGQDERPRSSEEDHDQYHQGSSN